MSFDFDELLVSSDVKVYHGGIVTFECADIKEQANIISANQKRDMFSFEFRWDRNKILYSISCVKDSVGSFFGRGFYMDGKERRYFSVSGGTWENDLVFKGIWIEAAVIYRFAIDFISLSIVGE